MSRMKKKERRSFFMRVGAILIAICMVAALALPAFAADTYTYTVRIFPGDKGTINGGTSPIVKEVEPGYKWTRSDFDYRTQAASSSEKYYVSGMRESGKDNNTNGTYQGGAFTVDHDIDLVISYGIKGSDVAYTINYVEYGSNTPIHSAETYYGNVGDKPAVAYLYIEGYVPQYENITGTLDADPAKNEWTFYYVDDDDESVTVNSKSKSTGSGSVTTQSTGTSTGSGTSTSSSSTSSGTSTSSSSTSSGTSTGSSTGTSASNSTGTATSTDTNATSAGTTASNDSSASSLSVGEGTMIASNGAVNTRKNGPVEIVDLDEQETPLLEYEGEDENSAVEENGEELIQRETQGVVRAQGVSPVKIVVGAVIVMIIAIAGWFFIRQRASEDEE